MAVRFGRVVAARDDAAVPLLTPGLAGLLLAWFALGLGIAPARPLLPVYVDAVLHRPPLFTSTLLALQLVTGAIGAIFGGSIADALGRKPTLLLGAASNLLSATLFLTGAPATLLALSLAAGLLNSVQTIGGQTYLMDVVKPVRLGMAAALFFLGSTLGTSVGNFLAGPMLDRWGFRAVAVAMLVVSGIVIGATALLLPAPAAGPAAGRARARGDPREYRAIVGRREVQLLVGLRFLPTTYWGIATLLIPLLLYRASGRPSTAATYSGISLALAASCQLCTGRIADLVGRRGPAAVLTACLTVAAALTAVWSGSVPGLYVAGIMGACSAWSLSVLMPGLIKELAAPGQEGRTLALTHFVWNVAMLTGSLVGGRLVEVDSRAPFWLGAALNLLAFLLALALLRTPARRQAEVVAASRGW